MQWLNEFKMQAPESASVVLVGNKLDLIEVNPKMRSVDKTAVETMTAANNIAYVEASAAVDKNVHMAFNQLIDSRRTLLDIILASGNETVLAGLKLTDFNQHLKVQEEDNYCCINTQ